MKIFKQLTYTLTALFLMIVPAQAGQVELQTEVSLYTAKEGVELTEEEQRVLHATIDYFVENPGVNEIVLNNIDFPNLTANGYNDLIENKIEYLTEHYPISSNHLKEYYNPNGFVYATYYTWATHSHWTNSGYREITITRIEYLDGAVEVQNYVNNLYSLLSQIGVYNGQDELEAISILCDFANSYITLSRENYGCYLDRTGACGDFATTLKALLNGSGIESYIIISNSEEHGWNQVIVDGVAYEIDTMWNLTSNSRNYYMLSREQMSQVEYHKNVEEIR